MLDVVMPYYGRADYLVDAVESVLRQDTDEWRLTVVDDASPSPEARDYLESLQDARIRYVRNEHNLGLSRNFQRALDLVDAPYFTMMGCDDLMLAGYVREVETVLLTSDWEVFQPGVTVIDEAGQPVRPLPDRVKSLISPRLQHGARSMAGEALATSLCLGDWMYFPALCWRTEAARAVGFRTDLRVALDLQLLLGVLVRGGRFLIRSQPVFAYRRHRASESSPTTGDGSRFREEAQVYEEARTEFLELGWARAARMARLRPTSRAHALVGAYELRREGNSPAATQLLRTAVSAAPQ